eukprot:6203196-Pleurochrysis_carterae.AAC.1
MIPQQPARTRPGSCQISCAAPFRQIPCAGFTTKVTISSFGHRTRQQSMLTVLGQRCCHPPPPSSPLSPLLPAVGHDHARHVQRVLVITDTSTGSARGHSDMCRYDLKHSKMCNYEVLPYGNTNFFEASLQSL